MRLMLERIKAPHQLDKIKSSNYLSNFCRSIAFMAMSIVATESIAQEVPQNDNEVLNSLHSNYDCRWSERFALNREMPNFYTPSKMLNGRFSNTLRKSGNIYVAERLNILTREYFDSVNPLFVTGREFRDGGWTPLSANGVGPEGYLISTDYDLGYLLMHNSEGDILDLLGDNCMTNFRNPELVDERCGIKIPKEMFYDAFANKLLFVDSLDGDLVSLDWQVLQNAYNSTQETLEPIMHLQQEARFEEGINEAAMLTPHHILFISNSNVPGMMTRSVNGWRSWDLVMNDELYNLVDDAAFIVWDQNYLGYVDLIMNNRTEFVRLQCGDVQSLYPGIPSFEQAHAGDLPACPEGQTRNSDFVCEVECEENQAVDENGECADLCINQMACNNGEIGECQMPAANADCEGVCLDGFEIVNAECVAVCGQFQARNENGECADLCINQMACNNGEIGECQMPAANADCEGVCLDGFEIVNAECVAECSDEEIRNMNGDCEVQEIDMAPLPEDMDVPEQDMGMQEADMIIESDMGEAPQEDMHTQETDMLVEADMGESQDDDMEQDMTVETQEDMMIRTDRNVSTSNPDMHSSMPKNDMQTPKSGGKSDGGCNSTPGQNSSSSVFAMMVMALGLNRLRRKKAKKVVNN